MAFVQMSLRKTCLVCALLPLAACSGGFGGRSDPVIGSNVGPDVHALATGAERRLVVSTTFPAVTVTEAETGKTYQTPETTLVCAEPSPDAIEAISASLEASIEANSEAGAAAKAQYARELTTAVSAVLRRTQGLQLFRDGVFALCQGSMNGLRDQKTIAQEFADLRSDAIKLIKMELQGKAWNTPVVVQVSPTVTPAKPASAPGPTPSN